MNDNRSFVIAAALSGLVWLVPFGYAQIAVLAALVLVVVRFSTANWLSLALVAVLPNVISMLVTWARFGEGLMPEGWGGAADLLVVAAYVVAVPAFAWVGDRLRPGADTRSSRVPT